MRRLLWALGLLAVPFAVAQHSITLNWQLPPTNATWTHGCGSGTGYDCTFLVFRNEVAAPIDPCSLNGGDYELIGQTSTPNATTYEDDAVLLGSSHCYGVATLQNSKLSPTTFLSAGGNSSISPMPATIYAGLTYYPLQKPCRMVDTRIQGQPSYGGIPGSTSFSFPLLTAVDVATGQVCIPSSAQATVASYELNFTVIPVNTTIAGYVTAWPTGEPQPITSTIDWTAGTTVIANSANVTAGTNGAVSVWPSQTTQLVIDCTGYYAP